MSIEAWDESGKPVLDAPGDLVCTKPFPSMPIYFLNDGDGQKYCNSYFAQFPAVWGHGDFVIVNSTTMGLTMLGRSDGTLNPAGVRFGTAELYNIAEKFSQIADAVAVGKKRIVDEDEDVILFVKMAPGVLLSETLKNELNQRIRTELSPRHVPSAIVPIKDIPVNTNLASVYH
jgi:acetoacetyl-CoA synthetase